MNRKIALGVFVVLLVLMVATVPSKASFNGYLETRSREQSKGVLSTLVSAVATGLQQQTVTYHNYIFFATAETNLGSRSRYVGLFGTWFAI
jgi:hypothetical protein